MIGIARNPVPAALTFALLVVMAAPPPARSQTPPQTPPPAPSMAPDPAGSLADSLDQAQAALRRAGGGARAGTLTDAELKARLAALPPIQARLSAAIAALAPRVQDADARLAQLGPAPAAGQPPEAAQTAEARRGVEHFRQQVHARLIQARLLSVESDQLGASLAEQIRRNFAARLWKQSRSAADPGLWREFAAAIPEDVARAVRAVADEADKLADAARSPGALAWVAAAAIFGFLILWPGRLVLGLLGVRRARALGPPTRLTRTLVALWLVLVSACTPLIALAAIRMALDGAGAMTPLADRAIGLATGVAVFASLLEGLGRAILSPRRPAWRLVPLSDSLVERLAPYPGLIALTAGLATLAAGVNSLLGVSLPTSVASDCATLLAELAAVGAGLAMLGRTRTAQAADALPGVGAQSGHSPGERPETRLPWVIAALAAWMALGVALAAVLFGYLALATFVMREAVWIATVLALLFLLLRLADDLFPALLSPAHGLGRAVRTAIGLSDGALEQVAVLLSGLARLALLFFAWALVVAPFGTSADTLVGRVASANTSFRVGQVLISPGAIFGAVALFTLGLLFTRAVRGWLVTRYLPRTPLDVGLRSSLASGVTYLGGFVAILFAFAYLGLSVSQIALFAGALSVGIGFGLQAIIGNFVSGLILLAERPVRVGDWIAIGDLEGDVKRISIRATEIEMRDRSRLIVPNSDLISKTVRNVTHAASIGRVRIVLLVTSDTVPDAFRDLVLAILAAHREVLREPKAAVFLSDVRDGDLEFTAFAYVASARQAYRVKSELLFQIVPALKARGIVLASTSPVVNIGLPDRLIEPSPTPEAAAGEVGGGEAGTG